MAGALANIAIVGQVRWKSAAAVCVRVLMLQSIEIPLG